MDQDCQSCGRTVSKLKMGAEWKIYLEHYAMDEPNSVSVESKAMCKDCFDAKKKGWKKFLKGKHFSLKGDLIQSDEERLKDLYRELEELHSKRYDIEKEIKDTKRKIRIMTQYVKTKEMPTLC